MQEGGAGGSSSMHYHFDGGLECAAHICQLCSKRAQVFTILSKCLQS
jgi:hypothetical protein